jgi:hypothetical protein
MLFETESKEVAKDLIARHFKGDFLISQNGKEFLLIRTN